MNEYKVFTPSRGILLLPLSDQVTPYQSSVLYDFSFPPIEVFIERIKELLLTN